MMSFVATAGYTEDLGSIDENVSDCGDWSGITNSRDTSLHSYFYRFRPGKNFPAMYNPETWGLPSDITFRSVGGRADDVSWAYLYVRGFDRTLIDEGGVRYTDNLSNVDYITGYCKYDGYSTKYWWTYEVNTLPAIVSYESTTCTVATDITVKCRCWSKSKKRYFYRESTTQLVDSVGCLKWGSVDRAVGVSITNCSGRAYILRVCMPANITGINITTNVGTYEKHGYYLRKNETSTGFIHQELCRHDFEQCTGLVPCGVNVFASKKPITDVTIKLYTPFEVLNASVTVRHAEEEKPDTRETPAMFFNVCLITGILYIIIKGALK